MEDISRANSMGPAKAGSLVAAFELGRRAADGEPSVGPIVRGPDEIAAVAEFILGDESGVINGALIPVYGRA